MKYRTQSANVLNEADDFERKLKWQLFAAEQDARLFGATAEGEWRPGDDLFVHPYNVGRITCECGCNGPQEGYEGHHVRPLFQLFDTADVWEDVPGNTRYEQTSYYPIMKCEDCAVSWGRDEYACWVCGKEYPVEKSKLPGLLSFWNHDHERPLARLAGVDFDGDTQITMFEDFDIDSNRVRFRAEATWGLRTVYREQQVDRDDLIDIGDSQPIIDWLRNEMRVMLWEEMNRAWMVSLWGEGGRYSRPWRGLVEVEPPPEPTIQGVRCDFTVLDEWAEITTPIRVSRSIVVPDEIDVSGRREIEPPVVNFQYLSGSRPPTTPEWEVPINQQRRTR